LGAAGRKTKDISELGTTDREQQKGLHSIIDHDWAAKVNNHSTPDSAVMNDQLQANNTGQNVTRDKGNSEININIKLNPLQIGNLSKINLANQNSPDGTIIVSPPGPNVIKLFMLVIYKCL
jgi:hypothetical protein